MEDLQKSMDALRALVVYQAGAAQTLIQITHDLEYSKRTSDDSIRLQALEAGQVVASNCLKIFKSHLC